MEPMSFNDELKGQAVIVFGAARGIGRAIANGFIEAGCSVYGFDCLAIDEFTAAGFAGFTCGDVTSLPEIEAFAATLNRVDHVIYSVGMGSGKAGFPFWNIHPTDWSRVIEVNLLGSVHVAHAFAPTLANQRSGSFLFLVSVAGQIGSQTDPPYSAAKAALINFMQCVAKDLAPTGVRANALSPGMVMTELNRSVWEASQTALPSSMQTSYEQWADEKLRRVSPLGRWQTPEEFAAMAVFLASRFAINITGQTINIDGGQVMHS
jgi:2-hydroxycyclohexanecarboxyl-CoA dehydrogenase